MHHPDKLDAPSGTAIKTAEMIRSSYAETLEADRSRELIPGARGAAVADVHVHSVRLPGLVAHQEVIFGGIGQYLTIRHDSINRQSFMPGVIMAIKALKTSPTLVYGLENLL